MCEKRKERMKVKTLEKPKKEKKVKKKRKTPVSRITAALRKIWMWSPERAEIMKRSNGECEECGCGCAKTRKKQEETGLPLLEIHHPNRCNMTEMAKVIHAKMFPGADKLDALCQNCHRKADEVLKREDFNNLPF